MVRRIWQDGILKWDRRLFLVVFSSNGRRLADDFFVLCSRMADGYAYAFVVGFILLVEPSTGRSLTLAGLFGFAIEIALYMIMKRTIRRDRPFQAMEGIRHLIVPPDQFSFPSGHTAGAFLFALLIGHAYPILLTPLLVWASLVGVSRVYLGVHYPSDVVAGSLLGLLSARMGLAVV